jgi:hypothetical protein
MALKVQNNTLKRIVALGFIFCFISRALYAAITIEPAYVEVELDKQRPAGRFTIANVGEEQERYRITALHFTFSENGALLHSKTGERSLAPWVHFNPRELVLPPKSRRVVRFTIIPRGTLEQGEYWAAMELQSLKVNETVVEDPESGNTVTIKTLTAMMVPIFGTVGEVSYEGVIKEIVLKNNNGTLYLNALIASTGTGRLGAIGNYEILNAAGEVVDQGPFAQGYILPGCQRWFDKKMEADLPEGRYTAKIAINAVHLQEPLVKQTQVEWPKVQSSSAAEKDKQINTNNKSNSLDGVTEHSTEAVEDKARMEPTKDG